MCCLIHDGGRVCGLSTAAQEAVRLKRFLNHLIGEVDSTSPVLVYCDSQAAIAYTKYPKYHSKTKHIDIKFKFVKHMVAHKKVDVKYVYTKSMVADPLTKPTVRDVFVEPNRTQGLRRC